MTRVRPPARSAVAGKPAGCQGCPLHHQGVGYVQGSGPATGSLAFLGEAPGYDEVALGQPFVGAAGGMHSRILRLVGLTREQYRHENVLRCCPPGYEIKREWAEAAAAQCAAYRTPALDAHQVIYAMGQTAIRAALGLWDYPREEVRVENYHGTVHDLPSGQRVVCGYHPSYLQRGATNLIGVASFDLQVALEVAAGTWTREPIDTVVDPDPEHFAWFVRESLAAAAQDPSLWLITDIETPDKAKGKSEDELDETDASYTIERVNFCVHPDEGWTVPYEGPYIPLIHQLLAGYRVHGLWNADYDVPRLLRAGHTFPGEIWDFMWLAHHLNSNIPLGLGFWAPFYSRFGAWKHLFSTDKGTYSALDGPQTLRVGRGVVQDLLDNGQWSMAHRHTVRLMQEVMKPAQAVGIQVNRPRLDAFEADLTAKADFLLARLQEIVPEGLRPLTPKEGLTKPPEGLHAKARLVNRRTGEALKDAEDKDPLKVALYTQHAKVVTRTLQKQILCCSSCGAEGIQARHRCADKTLTPQVGLQLRPVVRYFWQEPFNPDAPQQVLDYLLHAGHKPGRNKKTKQDSADRDTLVRLRATTKDPFYDALLQYRAVGKVRGTYAIGVRKRLDAQDRFHPRGTLRPSTLRTSYVAPNIQNVVGDKGGDNLASGFRECIVASVGPPPDVTPEELAAWEAKYGA